jgi:3-oxoacyl-[acyl-carrier-protein] synthase-3
MKPFRLNKHGKLVLPCSIFIDLDFSIISSLDHLQAIVRRDFEGKAPTGTEIAKRATAGSYATRYDLLRDISLNLFWANRFALTMYDKRPTRWRDVPRNRADIFVPLLQPWTDGKTKAASVRDAYGQLEAKWNRTAEDELFDMLFDVFSNKLYRAQELPPIKATIAEALAAPGAMTTILRKFNPDFKHYSEDEILDASEEQPEL